MALYLNVEDLPPGIRRLEITEEAGAFEFPVEEDLEVEGPVRVALQLARDGSTVMVSGRVEVPVGLVCSRCLSPFPGEIRAEIREIYHLLDGPPPFRPDEDGEIHFVDRRSPRVDLAPVIREQVLLEIPIKALCREDCLGLCPACGANLNDGPCGCVGRAADPRWEALGRLAAGAGGPGGATTPEPSAPNTTGEESS